MTKNEMKFETDATLGQGDVTATQEQTLAQEQPQEPHAESSQETNHETSDLSAQLEQAKQELCETKDRILRLHADFDNYRKRMIKEKEEWVQYASIGIMEKLLPIMDNFDLAISTLEGQKEEGNGVFSGVLMIHRQLAESLQKEGLQPIPALGQSFDPLMHEAIMQVPVEVGQQDNEIVEELRKGYRFKEKIIRPSMVKVAKTQQESEEE